MEGRPDCVRCGGRQVIKSGCTAGKQRWQCKGCQHRFTLEHKAPGLPAALRRDAVKLYREGVGFRGIGRLQGVSHTTARRWVSAHGESLPAQPPARSPVRVVEVDEMHHYVKKKTTSSGSGKR